MKSRTLTKGLFAFMLAGTLTLGIGACNKKEEPAQKSGRQELVEEDLKKGVEIKEVKPEEHGREYKILKSDKKYFDITIVVYPESLTGQTLEVGIVTTDNRHDLWNVDKIRLYEDSVMIQERKGDDHFGIEGLVKEIKHKEQGVHTYVAEVVYENGESRWSETKQVEFTGEIMDFSPRIARIDFTHYPPSLVLEAEDRGDNHGIVHYKVYEDGKLWIEGDHEPGSILAYWFFKTIPLTTDKTGKHSYYAEYTDKGGHTVKTETIKIDYD